MGGVDCDVMWLGAMFYHTSSSSSSPSPSPPRPCHPLSPSPTPSFFLPSPSLPPLTECGMCKVFSGENTATGPTSVELSRDREILTVAHGKTVTFVDASRYGSRQNKNSHASTDSLCAFKHMHLPPPPPPPPPHTHTHTHTYTLHTHTPTHSFEKLKSFTIPTQSFSASLHPDKDCFMAGEEDFKSYKVDFQDGTELGKHLPTLPSL